MCSHLPRCRHPVRPTCSLDKHYIRHFVQSNRARILDLIIIIIIIIFIYFSYYRPQKKLRKGNVFTNTCQEFCPQDGGGCLPDTPLDRLGRHPPWQADTPWADIPLGRHPSPGHTHTLPGRHPLRQTGPPPPQTVTAADGTHPTGMHSCFTISFRCCLKEYVNTNLYNNNP